MKYAATITNSVSGMDWIGIIATTITMQTQFNNDDLNSNNDNSVRSGPNNHDHNKERK